MSAGAFIEACHEHLHRAGWSIGEVGKGMKRGDSPVMLQAPFVIPWWIIIAVVVAAAAVIALALFWFRRRDEQ